MAMTTGNTGQAYSEINMTPLIDVMLVLFDNPSPQPEVHIGVDKFANYEVVAQTLADLQHRGLKKIGFVSNEYL